MAKIFQNSLSHASGAKAPSRLADYFWAALVFFGFLGLLGLVLAQTTQNPADDPAVAQLLAETFKFMFLLFGGSFFVVMLFDAAYDYFAQKAETTELEP